MWNTFFLSHVFCSVWFRFGKDNMSQDIQNELLLNIAQLKVNCFCTEYLKLRETCLVHYDFVYVIFQKYKLGADGISFGRTEIHRNLCHFNRKHFCALSCFGLSMKPQKVHLQLNSLCCEQQSFRFGLLVPPRKRILYSPNPYK